MKRKPMRLTTRSDEFDRKRRHPARSVACLLSSRLRSGLRPRKVVGLGAARRVRDWRSILRVLGARCASAPQCRSGGALESNACVVLALLQAVAFRRRSLTPRFSDRFLTVPCELEAREGADGSICSRRQTLHWSSLTAVQAVEEDSRVSAIHNHALARE
jgi:hypothetical protein